MRAVDRLVVTVSEPGLRPALDGLEGVDVHDWNLADDCPVPHADLVVGPGGRPPRPIPAALAGTDVDVLQLGSIGFEHVLGVIDPRVRIANAAGVFEPATAELAMALLLAMQRGIPDFVRGGALGEWRYGLHAGLTDRRVLLLGYGGIGERLERMLVPYEVEIERVASRARTMTDGRRIHAVGELPELLPWAEIVVVAVPLTSATTGLVDADFLARMQDGSLVVNVARGRVADTAAILAEAQTGRLRFALDTTDPEPLPVDHPLWHTPGVLVSPHVGGATSAYRPRLGRLVRQQAERLLRGEAPLNLVS